MFVHCWTCNLGFWRDQVPAFESSTASSPSISLDMAKATSHKLLIRWICSLARLTQCMRDASSRSGRAGGT